MPRKKAQTEESEDDGDSEEEKLKVELNRPKIDRILKDNINLKRIIINVSMTQYPVVSEVAEQLGWRIQTDTEAGDWDIFWTDFSIEPDILIRMHFHQKINHYPGIYTIARKNLLGLGLMAMRNKFPDEFNFFPLTWMLPSQYSEFRMYYQSVSKGKVRTYIVKPEAQCQGRGIFLTRNIEDLENGSHYVIQRYVTKPYLIDGLKFDLRIYVLLAGTEPLRVYIFEEGLARFATEPYVEPNSTNLQQTFIHLTNYAINKLNPKFVFNKSVNDMSVGHKRSLTSVYKLLEKKGENVALLKHKINEAIIKTLLMSTPLMSHQYRYSQPQEYSGNMCFHILGFDILITQSFEPLLLEVNHTPSFTTDTPLDTHIKHKLIKDTLVLMNINSKTKTSLFNKAKQYNSQRLLTGKRQIYQGQVKQSEIDKAQSLRDDYEDKHLGGFTKIHPVSDPELQGRYNMILEHATKTYQEENTLRARMEEKEAKKMLKEERQMFKKQKEIMQKIDKREPIVRSQTKPSSQPSKKSEISKTKAYNNAPIVKPLSTKNMQEEGRPLRNRITSNSQATSETNTQRPAQYYSQITGMIKISKDSIRQLHQTGVKAKYLSAQGRQSKSRLRNQCSDIVDLPYLPTEDKVGAYGLLLSQSQLIEERKDQSDRDPVAHSALNFKKANSYNCSTETKTTQYKIRVTKMRRIEESKSINSRNVFKTGNFVMPKIFDINLNVCLMEDRPSAIASRSQHNRFQQ